MYMLFLIMFLYFFYSSFLILNYSIICHFVVVRAGFPIHGTITDYAILFYSILPIQVDGNFKFNADSKSIKTVGQVMIIGAKHAV